MKYFLALFLALLIPSASFGKNRIKDLVSIKGVRSNPVIGYGLVIGLKGTGDGGGEVTNQSLKKMFETLGLKTNNEVSSSNVAAVIVTAELPPFSRIGQKVDVTVSSIGDASSLAGGTLLVTPLKGGDGNVYAIANGPISIGGLEKGQKFPTTAKIPSGAVIEKELNINFDDKKSIRLALNSSDFTTAARISRVINEGFGGIYAKAKDSSTIDLIIPPRFERKIVEFIAKVENLSVNPDNKAKIVINERTGTIVAGGDITLSTVAISHNDLSIQVEGEENKSVQLLNQTTTLSDLVKALNTMGATPEDLISIFQALKKNGALVAEIELI